jgi:hypothetical protein
MLERRQRIVDTLASDVESVCDGSGAARLVEIPTYPECSRRKDLVPVNVAQLRPEGSIRFDDRVIGHSDSTLIVRLAGFAQQALGQQLIQDVIQVGL